MVKSPEEQLVVVVLLRRVVLGLFLEEVAVKKDAISHNYLFRFRIFRQIWSRVKTKNQNRYVSPKVKCMISLRIRTNCSTSFRNFSIINHKDSDNLQSHLEERRSCFLQGT